MTVETETTTTSLQAKDIPELYSAVGSVFKDNGIGKLRGSLSRESGLIEVSRMGARGQVVVYLADIPQFRQNVEPKMLDVFVIRRLSQFRKMEFLEDDERYHSPETGSTIRKLSGLYQDYDGGLTE